jgi:multisubunit Na+/H+ antiporter MnhF subunit
MSTIPATSTVPAYKAALVALLTTALSTAQVIYGPRSTKTVVGLDVVTVGTVVGTPRFASLAYNRLAEDYTVEIVISCSRPGADSQQTATEAAMGFYVATRSAVLSQADSTLGVANVLSSQPMSEFELTETADESTRNATVVFQVSVQASE